MHKTFYMQVISFYKSFNSDASFNSFSLSFLPGAFSTPLDTSRSSGTKFSASCWAFSGVMPPANQSFVFVQIFFTRLSAMRSPVPPILLPILASIKTLGSPLCLSFSTFCRSASLATFTTQ